MECVLQCGFDKIVNSNGEIRESVWKKGHSLYESKHVFDLKEVTSESECLITAFVIPETSVSSKYKVEIKLDAKERKIKTKICECKAGLHQCKHIAAVIIAVNEESADSKTNHPQKWNIPSSAAGAKYKKGCSLEEIHPQKIKCPPISKEGPSMDLLNMLPSPNNCALAAILQAQMLPSYVETTCKVLIDDLVSEVDSVLCKEQLLCVISEIVSNPKPTYNSYELEPQESATKVLLKVAKNPTDSFYYAQVCITKTEAVELCHRTINQSECHEWFEQRKIRISSSKSHSIKTRQKDFESLAIRMCNSKPFYSQHTKYGIEQEPTAASKFSEMFNVKLLKVGLIINPDEPMLCCSPDGLFFKENVLCLLEIKCPSSCQNKNIVDFERKLSNVKYLQILLNENEINVQLKKSSAYYTQVQVSMYICNITTCFLFVYSAEQQITVKVQRDDLFLSEFIPKIKKFYFEHYLKCIR